MVELLPCPFCGKQATVTWDSMGYQIGCKDDAYCRGSVLHSDLYYYKREDAVKSWNTRTPKERGVQE